MQSRTTRQRMGVQEHRAWETVGRLVMEGGGAQERRPAAPQPTHLREAAISALPSICSGSTLSRLRSGSRRWPLRREGRRTAVRHGPGRVSAGRRERTTSSLCVRSLVRLSRVPLWGLTLVKSRCRWLHPHSEPDQAQTCLQ